MGAQEEEIQFVFSKPSVRMIQAAGITEKAEPKCVAKLNELIRWFEGYEVDSIELSIETSVKSGGVVNLFVSAEGKGGMTVTLRPKKEH